MVRQVGFYRRASSFQFYALNKQNGSPTKDPFNDTLTDRVVAGITPGDGVVYVGTADNYLLALDEETGEEKQRFSAGHSIFASPILDGEHLYVTSLDKSVYALNPNDLSDVQWSQQLGGSIMNEPALDEANLYVSSFDHILHQLSRSDGSKGWDFETTGWLWAGPAVLDGVVFVGDLNGILYGINAESGVEEWRVESGVGGVQAPPIVVGDSVVFVLGNLSPEDGEDAGMILVLSTEGEEQWRVSTTHPIFSQPVIINNDTLAVVPSSPEATIYLYDLATGAQKGAPLTPRSE